MTHPVVITIVYHPDDDQISQPIRDACLDAFDRLGMQRSGVHMRIPIRLRSEPLSAQGEIKPIAREADTLDVILFLQSPDMEIDPAPWQALLEDAEAVFEDDPSAVLPIKVSLDQGLTHLKGFASAQGIRWYDWKGLTGEERRTRLLLEVVNAIRERLGKIRKGAKEKIFVSHAKHDGRSEAEKIVRHVNDPAGGLHLATWYDARELSVGENWTEGLEEGVKSGSLLALASNAYDERPWCNQEIIWAKEYRRPILLVDIGRDFVHRTFPYLGNIPLRRYDMTKAAGIEAALLELLCEALRCDLFEIVCSALEQPVIALPRPPELLDFDFTHVADAPNDPIVYPDPPLPKVELDRIKRFAGNRSVKTIGEKA